MLKKHLNNDGFTLIEVMMSILILGILMIPIIMLITYNASMNIKAKNQIMATNIAEDLIQEAKFSTNIGIVEKETIYDNFIVSLKIEKIDTEYDEQKEKAEYISGYDIYKITVVVKLNEEVIERLITYRTLKSGSD